MLHLLQQLFAGFILTGVFVAAMCSTMVFNQLAISFIHIGSVSKPCTPGEHQNSW
jgi:Na+/proline symporter